MRLKELSLLKAQILAKLSHEIRTPLNAIIGFSSLILEKDDSNMLFAYNVPELLDHINVSSKHLLCLVNDILDMSKIDAQKITVENINFDLNRLVDNVNTISLPLAEEKKIKLDCVVIGDAERFFKGDPTKLSQVLVNLVNNGLKFTKPYGEVKLRVKVLSKHNLVKFSVIDNGIGIPEDALKRIFSMFSQENNSLTREYSGTGLGLSISSGLVEAFGGKLSVKSKQGVGSIFSFSIKLALTDDQSKFPVDNRLISLTSLNNKTCLIVEDFPLNQKVAALYLQKVGIKVDYANNGLEALEKLKECHYDFILMDLEMPVMDGLEATRIYRKTNKDDIVIALTANVTKEKEIKCHELGFNDFVTKPFNKEYL
ncbi:ATP-binding protein, partial [Vibrio aestuarianus]|uniref:hybrid sensor histidine kinase/response regulator n=1 Tax=Vibrio aestuarianus TaxID=28171 RepID=UPI00237CE01D